ncbi:MAG: hypothetical protein ACI9KN_001043 [Gammaproteobacteria bacterium]|jgi:hypothetical protein
MDSSLLKIKRAEKHLAELSSLFRSKKPFRYFVETNCKTGQRATFAKRDETVASDAAIIIGDIIHNLRSAVDHAYWNCTKTHAKSDKERKNIQFPITSTEDALLSSVLPGLPKRVSESFCTALETLKPYRDSGNKLLCAIHDLDILDKHKLLIPTGNFTKITSTILQKQIPDFPSGIIDCGAGNCHRDVAWNIRPMTWTERRKAKIPASNIIEKELDVPVDIVLNDLESFKPAIEALNELIEIAKTTIDTLYKGAKYSE